MSVETDVARRWSTLKRNLLLRSSAVILGLLVNQPIRLLQERCLYYSRTPSRSLQREMSLLSRTQANLLQGFACFWKSACYMNILEKPVWCILVIHAFKNVWIQERPLKNNLPVISRRWNFLNKLSVTQCYTNKQCSIASYFLLYFTMAVFCFCLFFFF